MDSIQGHFVVDCTFSLCPPYSQTPANSFDIKVHYSFDYAQQVHYPSDPLQPGPIYFLTPCKCTIFGVNYEAVPRQINFLTDEAGECGKGANAVVSTFFFENHCEKEVFLHADNCTGQNKNNCMVNTLYGALSLEDTPFISSCWAHKIFPRLVLWLVQVPV